MAHVLSKIHITIEPHMRAVDIHHNGPAEEILFLVSYSPHRPDVINNYYHDLTTRISTLLESERYIAYVYPNAASGPKSGKTRVTLFSKKKPKSAHGYIELFGDNSAGGPIVLFLPQEDIADVTAATSVTMSASISSRHALKLPLRNGIAKHMLAAFRPR